MKFKTAFSLATLAIGVIAEPVGVSRGTRVERDVPAITHVLNAVGSGLSALDTAVNSFSGDSSAIDSSAAALIAAINSQAATVPSSGALTVGDAIALAGPVQALQVVGQTLVSDLIATKSGFEAARLCSHLNSITSGIQSASTELINAIVALVPVVVQPVAQNLATPFIASLAEAAAAFAPGNCVDAANPTSSTTVASTSSNTEVSTSSTTGVSTSSTTAISTSSTTEASTSNTTGASTSSTTEASTASTTISSTTSSTEASTSSTTKASTSSTTEASRSSETSTSCTSIASTSSTGASTSSTAITSSTKPESASTSGAALSGSLATSSTKSESTSASGAVSSSSATTSSTAIGTEPASSAVTHPVTSSIYVPGSHPAGTTTGAPASSTRTAVTLTASYTAISTGAADVKRIPYSFGALVLAAAALVL